MVGASPQTAIMAKTESSSASEYFQKENRMPIAFEIHPSIGIARLGSSDEYFFGPEALPNKPDNDRPWESHFRPGPPPWDCRDGYGTLKRQVAHFRIFECKCDEHGQITKEPLENTVEEASITWRASCEPEGHRQKVLPDQILGRPSIQPRTHG